jgi:hypothetical protein
MGVRIVRILQLLALTTLSVAAASCTNIDGAGGAGGTAGIGGAGGTGGTRDTTLLPQPVLTADPESFAAEPPSDSVGAELGVATGQVVGACRSGGCSGNDPADQWSILPTVSGEHSIHLTWVSASSDLDLYLTDDSGAPLDESVNEDTVPETIIGDLTAGRLYIIQVQTFDTGGATQAYTLRVTRTE